MSDARGSESNGDGEPLRRRRPSPRRRWYHPRKSDFAFVLGGAVFLIQGLRSSADPTAVYASLALMGFAVAGRIDDTFGGKR